MRKHCYPGLAAMCLVSLTWTTAYSQSAYFQAMTNLNPVVYLPFQETTSQLTADVETNYGSLGSVGNIIYSGHNMSKGAQGVTGDNDASVSDSDAYGGFLALPTTDPRTGIQSPTFTVEAWVNPAEIGRNFEGIVAKSGGNSSGIRGSNNQGGFCLSENYIAYLDSGNMIGFDFHVYNGLGHGGAEAIVPLNVQIATWYHVVGVYDGTNAWLYIDGTNETAAGVGYQIPMTGSYVPDTWNQLEIGSSRNLNGNNYHGQIDEVAIYTNALTQAQIQNHFNAVTGVNYASTVLADNPYLYWRMNSPGYVPPTVDQYPAAANFGTNASTFGAVYGMATTPGVQGPQYSGMFDPNNGNASYAVAINGIGGNNGDIATVPVGFSVPAGSLLYSPNASPVIITNSFTDPNAIILNPTNGPGRRMPFSISVWFKGNPTDQGRFQTIIGHSDSGWRMSMNGNGTIQWNPGPGGETAEPYFVDDDNWHMFLGTYDGTNVLTYVDGTLVQTASTSGTGNGSALFPMIGGDPFYQDGGNPYAAGNGGTGNTTYRNRNFSGNLAHFAFFNGVVSASQVLNLYSTAVTNQAPTLLLQPIGSPGNGTVPRRNPAQAFMFEAVVAYGTGPIGYQWYFNTVSNTVGATQLADDGVKYYLSQGSQLVVSNLQTSDTGYYFCVVTNNYGSVTSHLGWVVIDYTPVITAQNPAANFSLFPNQTFTLSISTTVDPTNTLSYQWYTNGVGAGNQTASSYPITATANLSGVTYQCVVSNVYGAATSAPVTLTVAPFPTALATSSFSSNILALNPTAYWPMHEAGETPAAAEVETNYGSWGAVGLGYYDDWRAVMSGTIQGNLLGGGVNTNLFVLHNFPGAIAGDPNPAVELSGANRSYIVVPHTPGMPSLTPPFTLECWVKPNNNRGFWAMLADDIGANNSTGVRSGFDWIYSGTANTFSITVYSGTNGNSTEPKTTANYPPGYWYHVVTTFDGNNVAYYINGVQDGLQNSPAAAMGTNTWDPITMGCCRGLNANVMQGVLDEVAVYPSILPLSEIQKHYNDGTNASFANYKGDVLADNPILYYRMDSPTYTMPPMSQWPVLTNYGSIGLNGIYTPGSVPGGGVGPSQDGFAAAGMPANSSLAGNGCSMFADAFFNSKYQISGKTPFTVAAWMKGNPADAGRGWQSLVARSDWAWRLNIDGNGGNPVQGNGYANFNIGNGNPGGSDIGNNGASRLVNDGQWHYVMGTFDGTNTIIWVDGLKTVSSSNTGINLTNTANIEAFIGAYPNTGSQSSSANYMANEIGRVFAGSICEAAFWNGVALSTNQVQTLYSAAGVGPTIAVQPVSGSANENAGFTNSVTVAGSVPLSYQWYRGNQPLPLAGQTNIPAGATNSTLVIFPIKPSDQDINNYYVVITNNYGAVTSVLFSVNPVFTVPVVTNDIVNTNIVLYAGGHAAFSILAVGAVPLHYQWYTNDVAVSGATATSFALQNVQPPGGTLRVYCVVTNTLGTGSSSTGIVNVLNIPSVIPYSLVVLTDNPVGFWPMDETNGVIANDYWAGNDGIYTNALLGQPGFNPTVDSNRTAVAFGSAGSIALANSDIYGIPTNVDFSAPSGSNSNFSVECWVQGFQQTVDAGLVTKGYGGGGEQWNLDCGSDGVTPSHAIRFFFRDAAGATHSVASSVNPVDGLWHHIVGVCNETNGQVILYADGFAVGTNTFSPGLGVLPSTRSMTIGARPSNSTTNVNDFQFNGDIQDVAVYNYALSAQQVLNHYNAGDIPASVFINPTNVTVGEFGTAVFTQTPIGTPPLAYQWYTNGMPMGGATNATFFFANAPFADNGMQVYLSITNNFGSNSSATVNLTVIQGLAQFLPPPPAQVFVESGQGATFGAVAYGTMPLSYQWQVSDTNEVVWTNLSDNARITGSLTNAVTITNARKTDAGAYQLIVNNSYGSVTSSITILTVGSLPLNFNGNGLGWSGNQAGTYGNAAFTDGTWEGTESANGSESRSTFFTFPQYVGAFQASFIYQDVSVGGADGTCFVIQNDTRGAAALGGGGGSLGVSGITPSWELEINVYSGTSLGLGYNIFTNGNNGNNILPGSVNFAGGNPIAVAMSYLNGRMSLTMTDLVSSAAYATNFAANIPAAAGGSTAYVGFTAADGGSTATQIITNFTFVSITGESIVATPTNTVVIMWPGAISGYVVQQNTNLNTPNWVNLTNQDNVINNQHQVIVPIIGSKAFYRLNLQQ